MAVTLQDVIDTAARRDAAMAAIGKARGIVAAEAAAEAAVVEALKAAATLREFIAQG